MKIKDVKIHFPGSVPMFSTNPVSDFSIN
jgi:hypothetical protein